MLFQRAPHRRARRVQSNRMCTRALLLTFSASSVHAFSGEVSGLLHRSVTARISAEKVHSAKHAVASTASALTATTLASFVMAGSAALAVPDVFQHSAAVQDLLIGAAAVGVAGAHHQDPLLEFLSFVNNAGEFVLPLAIWSVISTYSAQRSGFAPAAAARAKAAEVLAAAEEATYAGGSVYANVCGANGCAIDFRYAGMQCLQTEHEGQLVWVCI